MKRKCSWTRKDALYSHLLISGRRRSVVRSWPSHGQGRGFDPHRLYVFRVSALFLCAGKLTVNRQSILCWTLFNCNIFSHHRTNCANYPFCQAKWDWNSSNNIKPRNHSRRRKWSQFEKKRISGLGGPDMWKLYLRNRVHAYKDRLCRFGYVLFKQILRKVSNNCSQSRWRIRDIINRGRAFERSLVWHQCFRCPK